MYVAQNRPVICDSLCPVDVVNGSCENNNNSEQKPVVAAPV